jgi:hypothetical protein
MQINASPPQTACLWRTLASSVVAGERLTMILRTIMVTPALLLGLAASAGAQSGATNYEAWRANYGADCNADGTVDAADFVVWRRNYGAIAGANTVNTGLLLWKGADLNCSGQVDGRDYVIWRKTLGP